MREAFPEVPIVADLKTMDGGYLEAEMMAQAGASVVLVARGEEKLAEALDEITALGGKAVTYTCDISDFDACDALIDEIAREIKPDVIQLHGSETAARAAAIKTRSGIAVMKAVKVANSIGIGVAVLVGLGFATFPLVIFTSPGSLAQPPAESAEIEIR